MRPVSGSARSTAANTAQALSTSLGALKIRTLTIWGHSTNGGLLWFGSSSIVAFGGLSLRANDAFSWTFGDGETQITDFWMVGASTTDYLNWLVMADP